MRSFRGIKPCWIPAYGCSVGTVRTRIFVTTKFCTSDGISSSTRFPTTLGPGLKIYLINSVFNGTTLLGMYWQHNPAMVYGSMLDSLVAWYPYSGDEDAIKVVQSMLDYQIAYGTTPSDWAWPDVPVSTSCGNDVSYGRCLQDVRREFYAGIGTGKIGELGTGYVLFYKLTGDRKYLQAAVTCANALASHVRPGDATHTPWPFRVDARTGALIDGEEYGGIITSSLRLFDELIRLKEGNVASYERARDTAWKWVLHYPLNKDSQAWDKWSGYFEDVAKNTQNLNQEAPDYTAYYILTRPDPTAIDSHWVAHLPRPWTLLWRLGHQRTANSRHGSWTRQRLLLARR